MTGQVLHSYGAEVNSTGRLGLTALHHACISQEATHDAVRLLLLWGSNPNSTTNTGDTALHFACQVGLCQHLFCFCFSVCVHACIHECVCVCVSYHFMFFDAACMVFDTSVVNYPEDFQSSKVYKIPDARLLLLLILPGLSVSNAQASRQKINCSFITSEIFHPRRKLL